MHGDAEAVGRGLGPRRRLPRASTTRNSAPETTRIAPPMIDIVTDAACAAIAGSV
jgi:hypothetical protein